MDENNSLELHIPGKDYGHGLGISIENQKDAGGDIIGIVGCNRGNLELPP